MSSHLSVRLGGSACARVPALPRSALYSAIEQELHPVPVVVAGGSPSGRALRAAALSAALSVAALLPLDQVQAATITVTTSNDVLGADGACSIREAFYNANTGSDTTGGECAAGEPDLLDTIQFDPALLDTTITIISLGDELEVDPGEPLALVGPGAELLALDGGGGNRHIFAYADLSVSGLTFQDGYALYGGAIVAKYDLTVTDSVFEDNYAESGGALANAPAFVAIIAPDRKRAKGVAAIDIDWTITGTQFFDNHAAPSGGGLFPIAAGGAVAFTGLDENASLSISDSGFYGNSALPFGGQARAKGGPSGPLAGGGGALFITAPAEVDTPDSDVDVSLSDVRFAYNVAVFGGGALVFASSITLDQTDFDENHALDYAGGAFLAAGKYEGAYSGNPGVKGGPGYTPPLFVGSLAITDSGFDENSAYAAGGGAFAAGSLSASGLVAHDNYTTDSGGLRVARKGGLGAAGKGGVGCYGDDTGGLSVIVSSSLTFQGVEFSENCSGEDVGGAAVWLQPGAQASIDALSRFAYNRAEEDAAGLELLMDHGSSATIAGEFAGNVAYDGNGGGLNVELYGDATVLLDGIDMHDNGAGDEGGGVSIEAYVSGLSTTGASITIQNSTIQDNFTDDNGGGVNAYLDGRRQVDTGGEFVYVEAPHALTIANSIIAGNFAYDEGGGVSVYGEYAGPVSILDSTFDQNVSYTDEGGGLIVQFDYAGSVQVSGTTFSDNTAVRGGGLYLDLDDGQGTIVNSTFHGNHAVPAPFAKGGVSQGSGGGIATFSTDLSLQFVTITGNDATGAGGGLAQSGGSVVVENSIIAGNSASASPDIDGTVEATFTLIGDATGTTIAGAGTGNDIGGDPMLGPLADNGGPTLTRAPLAGSPVVNSGDPGFAAPPDTDQRGAGFPREVGVVDKGAVELFPQVTAIAISPDPFSEGATTDLTVTLDIAAPADVTVTVDFTGVAALGADFTAADADAGVAGVQVVIPTGSSSGSIVLSGLADGIDELSEDLTATIAAVEGAGSTGTLQDSATLLDTDPTPTLSIDDASVAEGGVAGFTVSLSGSSSQSISVDFSSGSGTALAGQDFTAVAGTLNFAPGATTQPIDVTTLDDAQAEASENFTIALSAPVNAVLGDAEGLGTITDSDVATMVTLSLTQTSVVEEGGTTSIVATLSAPASQEVIVTLGFGGSATQGTDFTVEGTQIVIPAGATSGSVVLTTLDDVLDEGSESVIVDILAVTNATESGTQQGTITIDDSADGAGTAPPQVPQPLLIPTLSEWMLLLLGLLLPATVVARLRRQPQVPGRHRG